MEDLVCAEALFCALEIQQTQLLNLRILEKKFREEWKNGNNIIVWTVLRVYGKYYIQLEVRKL